MADFEMPEATAGLPGARYLSGLRSGLHGRNSMEEIELALAAETA
jgi:hypothetical protein